jgi:hypothetical protein
MAGSGKVTENAGSFIACAALEFPAASKSIVAQSFLKPETWKDFVGFALVQPDDDVILPVRSNYNGITSNIANNFLKHKKPIWQPIPDIVASVIRTKKIPRILVSDPHGSGR